MIPDMHIHSNNSHDASSTLDEICASAIGKGIDAVAITDHLDVVFSDRQDVFSCVRSSFEQARAAGEKYKGKLEVLAGIEIGDAMLSPDFSRKCAEALDYDVIIGSIHTAPFDEWTAPYSLIDLSLMDDATIHKLMSKYFDDLDQMLAECDFDIFAHLTCPLRYINGKYNRGLDLNCYAERIETILGCVIKRDLAFEVNTSGFGTSVGFMPNEDIVKRYVELGGKKITLGSDAHVAENIGKGFCEAVDMLKGLGIKEVYSFKKRCPIAHKI